MPLPNFKVYGHLSEMCCIYSYSGIYSKGTKLWDGYMSSHKVSPRPSATSWPYKQCLLCSALLLEYEICMGHKEHMDHPSQYAPQKTIKKIIKPNTHWCARTHLQYVHTKWHTNMHSHVVHNGLSVSTPTFC